MCELKNVYGYEDEKAELNMVFSWYMDESIRNNKNIKLPKGVLLYGDIGCGKTLMMREFAKMCGAPYFIVNGDNENLNKEVSTVFENARKEPFALVLIDELDLLIDKNRNLVRTLQQEMDGLNDGGKLFVMATTNHHRDIPDALLRPGRFDKQIEITTPDKETRKIMIREFLNKLNCNFASVDIDRLAKITSHCEVATIQAICNDAFLRCGKDLTTKDLEKSYDRVENGNIKRNVTAFKKYNVAVHEAGHIVALLNSKYWTFYQASFNEKGGTTERNHVDERDDNIEKRKEHIMVSLAGSIAEELVIGHHDVGSYDDYNKSYDHCQRLLQRVCVNGIKWLQRDECELDEQMSRERRRRSELVTSLMLKHFERKTKRIIKKNINLVKAIANKMMEQGTITYEEACELKVS